MTMHLLPAYWTTNNHKKRKKKVISKKEQQSILAHEKFLKSVGYNPNYKRKPTPLKLDGPSNQLPEKNIKDMDWSPCVKKNTPSLSGDYIIGQAYNKGNLQVLSKSDSADDSTGKRR